MLFDYKEISTDSISKDYEKSIELCDQIINEVKKSSSDKEKLSKMDSIEQLIDTLNGRTAFMAQVHPEEKIRKEGSKIEAQIENYYLQLALDRELFEAINNIDENNLDPDDKRYHEFLLRDFEDAGQLLDDEERKKLQKIDEELIDLCIEFEENIAKDRTKLLFEEDELTGLTDHELGSFNKEGDKFVVTMAYPHISAVMENCSNRTTREKLWKAFSNRAKQKNPEILYRATELRHKKAKLQKKKTWAEYRLHYRMAESPKNVEEMYKTLLPILKEAGVVDSGGLGFLAIIEGGLAYLKGESVKPLEVKTGQLTSGTGYLTSTEEDVYGYCTQFLIHGVDLDS